MIDAVEAIGVLPRAVDVLPVPQEVYDRVPVPVRQQLVRHDLRVVQEGGLVDGPGEGIV